jgi:hypothetical protein
LQALKRITIGANFCAEGVQVAREAPGLDPGATLNVESVNCPVFATCAGQGQQRVSWLCDPPVEYARIAETAPFAETANSAKLALITEAARFAEAANPVKFAPLTEARKAAETAMVSETAIRAEDTPLAELALAGETAPFAETASSAKNTPFAESTTCAKSALPAEEALVTEAAHCRVVASRALPEPVNYRQSVKLILCKNSHRSPLT